MRIVKFLGPEHFFDNFEHAGKYCWYLGDCAGTYFFAPLSVDRELAKTCSNIIDIINKQGEVIITVSTANGVKDFNIKTPSDVIDMINEVLPEAFTHSIINVDNMLYYESMGIEKFIRSNANIRNTEWTSDDILNPAKTIGQIFTLYSMRELPLTDESIVWLNANKFDEICNILQRVDAQPLMSTDNSCWCVKNMEITDSCSALHKYINYKNDRTVDDFGNIQFIHKLFFTIINDENTFNNDLAEELISFAEAWCNNSASTSLSFSCPCTETNTELVNIVNKLKKAIDFLKEGEESICLREKFITFWISRFIEAALK